MLPLRCNSRPVEFMKVAAPCPRVFFSVLLSCQTQRAVFISTVNGRVAATALIGWDLGSPFDSRRRVNYNKSRLPLSLTRGFSFFFFFLFSFLPSLSQHELSEAQ